MSSKAAGFNYGEIATFKPVEFDGFNLVGSPSRNSISQTKAMSKSKRSIIEVQGTSISILVQPAVDYISLTDMVKNFDGAGALIEQWLKNKDTVLFLAAWERINNPSFNSLEFKGIKNEAGRNSFFLSAKKWSDLTGAVGLIASAGRYGGIYAHRDIAFEFGSWQTVQVMSSPTTIELIPQFSGLRANEP